MTSKSQTNRDYSEEIRAMQLRSSIRNTALLQRLKDLEEKVKDSSLKTERLKQLREEARKEAQVAAQNSKPPIPRKESQVYPGFLTSTPYRCQPIRRDPDGINLRSLHHNRKATAYLDVFPKPGLMGNSKNMEKLKDLRRMDKFSNFRNDENLLQKSTKTTKFSPMQEYNVRHFIQFKPNIQRTVENSTNSARMPSGIAVSPGCSFKPNAQHFEDFHEYLEELPMEELASDDEDLSDEDYQLDKMCEESPNIVKMWPSISKDVNTECAISEENLTKSKLSDTIEIPAQVRFLVNPDLTTMQVNSSKESASVDTQAEILTNAERWTNAKTRTLTKTSKQVETNPTKIDDIAKTEIVTSLSGPKTEETIGNVKNEENPEFQRKTENSLEKENSIQHLSVSIEEKISEINEITTKMDILSTSETVTKIMEDSNILKPSESEILMEVEHMVEPGFEDISEAKLTDNESVNGENLGKEIVSETRFAISDNLTKMPEYRNVSMKSEFESNQQSPKILEIVQNSEKEATVDIQQEKTTGSILSFLSSDEDDDDEDSFFDSIPKPHAPVVQEKMADPQLKQNVTIKPEEISDKLSDDDDSDIDRQLADLVTTTVPIRFVEHEMAQSKQDLQKEENAPSKIPQRDSTTKDANFERSTESGLTSQPLPMQAEKQPTQRLHQKLAMHLGLDTKSTFNISEPDLKKDENQVEEDDFNFYD